MSDHNQDKHRSWSVGRLNSAILTLVESVIANGMVAVITDGNTIDTGNSSTTVLGAGGVFPGVWTDTLSYSAIIVSIRASHASATDGLHVIWSDDGITERDHDQFDIAADTGKTFSFQPAWRYVKVEYTNGGTPLTSFRLLTQLKKTPVKSSSHRIADSISGQDDAELIKAVLSGEDPDGIFRNILATVDGVMKISDESSGMAIAEGNVTGKSFVHKFGAAPDFDTGDGEVTIWDGAEDNTAWENMVYDYSATADIDTITSDNNGDTQDIEIQGLDSNYDLVTQTVTLTGQTKATLGTPLIRIFRAKNVGSVNLAGHVFVYPDTPIGGVSAGVPTDKSKIRCVIHPENNQTEMAVYTIPNGYTGYMRSWYAVAAGASKDSNYLIKLMARPFGQVFQLKHKSSLSDTGTSYIHHEYVEPEVFSAKTDIEMTVEMLAAGASEAAIAGGFDIVLVAD